MKRGLLIAILSCLLFAGAAQAAMYDLTTAGSSAVIEGGYFYQFDPRAAGSGTLKAFVRYSSNPDNVDGYCTDGRPLTNWPDVNTSPTHTHALQLGDIPVVDGYFEFVLDVNENNNELISMDDIKIYLAPMGDTGTQTTATIASLGTLMYNLDKNNDNWIKLDARLSSGSGQGDMVAYIPVFAGDPTQYVYFYSKLGYNELNHGGYEEWGYVEGGTGFKRPPPEIPEPATMLLLCTGLIGLGFIKKKK